MLTSQDHPPSRIDESMACDDFYVTVFKSVRFHLSTQEMMHFQKSPLLKRFRNSPFSVAFSGVLVWTIGENALVWMGLKILAVLLIRNLETLGTIQQSSVKERKKKCKITEIH